MAEPLVKQVLSQACAVSQFLSVARISCSNLQILWVHHPRCLVAHAVTAWCALSHMIGAKNVNGNANRAEGAGKQSGQVQSETTSALSCPYLVPLWQTSCSTLADILLTLEDTGSDQISNPNF